MDCVKLRERDKYLFPFPIQLVIRMRGKKGTTGNAIVIGTIFVLALLYIINETTIVVRDPSNDDKSVGEITGKVAVGIAGDVGDIIGTVYDSARGTTTSNTTNEPIISNTTIESQNSS